MRPLKKVRNNVSRNTNKPYRKFLNRERYEVYTDLATQLSRDRENHKFVLEENRLHYMQYLEEKRMKRIFRTNEQRELFMFKAAELDNGLKIKDVDNFQ